MRNYRDLIKFAKENSAPIVVTRDELIKIRAEYDKKYTLESNRLQNGDLTQGRGSLNGAKLVWGEWIDLQTNVWHI